MKNISNNRWLTIISIILLVANAVTLTLLWSNHSKHRRDENAAVQPPPPGGQAFEYITNELKLTQQQQDAYKVLREAHHAAQVVLQDSIRKSKDVFFDLLQMPSVNDTVLHNASKKGLEFQEQLEIMTFKHFQQVRALCTPEQQKRFDEIIKEVVLQMNAPRMRPPGPPPAEQGKDSSNTKQPAGKADGMDRMPPPPPGKWGRRPPPPPPGEMPPPPGQGRRGDGPPPRENN
jgi:Spy/CpxP family protein refolding chaperone